MTLGDIAFRDNHRLSLITIRRAYEEATDGKTTGTTEHTIGVPDNSTLIQENDCFVLFGQQHDIENFIKINQ